MAPARIALGKLELRHSHATPPIKLEQRRGLRTDLDFPLSEASIIRFPAEIKRGQAA